MSEEREISWWVVVMGEGGEGWQEYQFCSSPEGSEICASSGEGRAGAWEFRNHCICIRLIQRDMARGNIMLNRDGEEWI